MPHRSKSLYHISTTLPVPLSFAFRWCTDFRADDARREGESYERRVLERSSRRVVYEDIEATPTGWYWARYTVSLLPPDRWHAESIGNWRDATLDYRLTPLGPRRTRFELTWTRRPTTLGGKLASRRSIEQGTLAAWRRFARSIQTDYRKSRRK